MPDSLSQLKRKNLKKRLTSLHEDYEAANAQLNHTLDEVARVRLRRQIEDLEQEIQQVEQKLDQITGPPTPDTSAKPDVTGIPDQFESAIIRLLTTNQIVVGAGFLVADRQAITCAHVVAQALNIPDDTPESPTTEIYLDFPLVAPGHILTARVVCWQPEADIAGLELVEAPPANVQAVCLVTANNLWGHTFRVFGFPADFDQGVWASGLLRGRQAGGWVQIEDVKQTGYFVQPGFSGGLVWDEQLGGVVGMVVAADVSPRVRAAFIIPGEMLAKTWPIVFQYFPSPHVPKIKWSLAIKEATKAGYATITRQGLLYVVSKQGAYAVDVKLGRYLPEQTIQFDEMQPDAFCIQDDTLYLVISEKNPFASQSQSQLITMNLQKKKVIWKGWVEARELSPPMVVGREVYMTTDKNELIVWDQEKQQIDWKLTLPIPFYPAQVTYYDHHLFFPSRNATLLAVNTLRKNRAVKWQVQFEFEKGLQPWLNMSPTIVDNQVCVTFSDGTLAMVNLNGQLKWQQRPGNINRDLSLPTSDTNNIYVGNRDGEFFALSKDTGQIVWQYPSLDDESNHTRRITGRPLVYRNVVYFTAWDHHLYVLNAKNGQFYFRYPLKRKLELGPLLTQDYLIIIDRIGNAHMLKSIST